MPLKLNKQNRAWQLVIELTFGVIECYIESYVTYNISVQVTSYIREQSRNNSQVIVISLKEEFYSRSDALLGVFSEVPHLVT